jgi:hypothetical protein
MRVMKLSQSVSEKVAAAVAGQGALGFVIDDEARSHGAIALYGSIGVIWGLRPDGTFWKFDEDLGLLLTPLEEEWEHTALVLGAERYPWLSEAIPPWPSGAIACASCKGTGWVGKPVAGSHYSRGLPCPHCKALGWARI